MFAVFITHLSDFSKFPDLILNLDQTMVFALLPDEDPVGFIFLSRCSGSEKHRNTKPRNSQPNNILKNGFTSTKTILSPMLTNTYQTVIYSNKLFLITMVMNLELPYQKVYAVMQKGNI